MITGWFRGRISFSEALEMPVGYIQTLYALAIEESEKAKEDKDNSKAMEALEDAPFAKIEKKSLTDWEFARTVSFEID